MKKPILSEINRKKKEKDHQIAKNSIFVWNSIKVIMRDH